MRPAVYIITLLLLLQLATSNVYAQQGVNKVKINAANASAIALATVRAQHYTDTLYTAAATDNLGVAVFNKLVRPETIQVSYLGKAYGAQAFNSMEVRGEQAEITITISATELQEITVRQSPKVLKYSDGKFMYNAANDTLNRQRSTMEVVRRAPFVSVDFNGNPALMGSTEFVFQLNGRDVSEYGLTGAEILKTLAPAMIERIEVATAKDVASAGNAKGGVVNIITRGGFRLGQQLNITEDISAGKGYENKTALNYLYGMRKTSVVVNVGMNNFKSPGIMERYNALNGTAYQQGEGAFTFTGNKLMLFTGYNTQLNNRSSLNINLTANTNNSGFKQNLQESYGAAVNKFNAYINNTANAPAGALAADYKYAFKDGKNTLAVSALGGLANSESDVVTESSINRQGKITEHYNADSRRLITTADHVYNNGKTRLKSGLKYYNIYTDALLTRNDSTYATANTEINNTQQNTQAYTQLIYSNSGWTYAAGLRYEHAAFTSAMQNNIYNNTFNNLLPGATIAKQKGRNVYQVNFSTALQRPTFSQLNPQMLTEYVNVYNTGNPALRPAITYSANAVYAHYGNKLSVFTTLGVNSNQRHIIQQRSVTGANTYITYANALNYTDYSANLNLTYNPTDKLTAIINAGVRYIAKLNGAVGYYSNKVSADGSADITWLLNKGYTINGFIGLYSPQYSLNYKTTVSVPHSLSVSKALWAGRGTIALTAQNWIFKWYNTTNTYSYAGMENTTRQMFYSRMLGLRLSYKLGGSKYNKVSTINDVDTDAPRTPLSK